LNHPLALKLLFALFRRFRPITIVPITITKKIAVVTKAKDVRDVLSRLEDFATADVLGPKLPWGPFVVSVDWPEQHARERAFLQSVVFPASDVAMIRDNAATKCGMLIQKARQTGDEIDVVSGLCEPVIVDMVQSYFGVPVMGTPREMAHVLSQVAGFIMVDPPVGSDLWYESRDCIARLTNTITSQIKQEPDSTQPALDLLTRLVIKFRSTPNPRWFDENWIRRYITGLTVFGGATVIRAATQAIDRLLEHPAGVRQARALAMQLGQNADQGPHSQATRSKLLQIAYEALRFRPMLPLLDRYVPREAMIAKGAAHARMAPAGATLFAPPLAAMYDPEEFPRPWRFSTGRCLNSYIHFGNGPRLCFGKYIADELLVEIFRALLLLGNIRRARGLRGRLKYDGPAVWSLVLTFK
jgi:cytochrome P450